MLQLPAAVATEREGHGAWARERKGQGAKVPVSERARERIGQGAKVPGSELSRVLLADSLRGANWPESEKARYHEPCTGHTGQYMNMHRPYWPHWPYSIYMAVLYTKQAAVKLSQMLMKSTHRLHRLPQQTRIGRRTAQTSNTV